MNNNLKGVKISMASNDDVLNWSHGEVTQPETINYKTFKPEKNGLFDERIFGPSSDYKCPICGTKYKHSNEGSICEKTDECKLSKIKVEILPKISRRTRMGHIELATPIVHIWYLKIDHSTISKIISSRQKDSKKVYTKKDLENIVYFKSHIVLETGGLKTLSKYMVLTINDAVVKYYEVLNELLEKQEPNSDAYNDIKETIENLNEDVSSQLGRDYGIDFYIYNEVIETYSDAKFGVGAEAIEYILSHMDLEFEINEVKKEIHKINALSVKKITDSKKKERTKLFKRLKILRDFQKSHQSPNSMIIKNLPVIPADLRPLIQLDGGRHSTTDVNELYRKIIIRNNRLRKWLKLDAPALIVQNEKRMLQEAVDAVLDNARKTIPTPSKDNRPLKSIADALVGKKGRFRQNLLGKRVDYSGRSVIVVGPNLKMHEAGIPRQMAAKLFEPFIVRELVDKGISQTIKMAKKYVDDLNPIIWPFVESAIEDRLILLNRAPTLHRLSIQAFKPTLVRGKAIKLHPLVTTAFNADFDGDQMAVHVPISTDAINEAKELMMGNRNILGPKDGEPIINPSQDMILGLFYLTREIKGAKGEGHYFSSYDEMYNAYLQNFIDIHARVAISTNSFNNEIIANYDDSYVFTSVGKFIFNNALPQSFPFIFSSLSIDNADKKIKQHQILKYGENIKECISKSDILSPFKKGDIAKIARRVFDDYSPRIYKKKLSKIITNVNSSNYDDLLMQFDGITNPIHAKIISDFIKNRFVEMNQKIKYNNENIERTFESSERAELLDQVWFDYTNLVASILDNIKDLGFHFSTKSGTSMSMFDIIESKNKDKLIKNADKKISKLNKWLNDGVITEDEKYLLTIDEWTSVKEEVQKDLEESVKLNPGNPIFMMMQSGARGSISNFVQLAGMRGLMAKGSVAIKAQFEKGSSVPRTIVDVPVKSSFLNGLSAFEFFSSTHGARKGLTDTALNTARSGYLTRRLVDASQDIIVKEGDCGTDFGSKILSIIDTKTNTEIVSLRDRIIGRYSLKDIFDKKDELIIAKNKLITIPIAERIIANKINVVHIRSIFGCVVTNGVCKKCYGLDLSTNSKVNIGEAVGIISAQSIGEPGTQLTMRTFHTGGVAGVEDITGGFQRLTELIDAVLHPWGNPAIISHIYGTVEEVKHDREKDKITVKIVKTNIFDNESTFVEYSGSFNRRIRVKKGQEVKPGYKIFDGPIVLHDLLEIAGIVPVQNYLMKEIQRIYRMQGIAIADKYIELIIRQMLSKAIVLDPGDTELYPGSLVDIYELRDLNAKMFARSQKPAQVKITIQGIKRIPSLSSSFLASASYQETSQIIVKSAIGAKVDYLFGLKENIIIGNKIPAGTGYSKLESNSKYDLSNSNELFDSYIGGKLDE